VTGWFADFFRLAWGLLYWNTRKSWFRLRRGRARCPCQSPSDSGLPLATHCDPVVHWAKARRFRRLCPLLVETPEGWRCSAHTADVRPFWGRALGYYGGTLAVAYLVGALLVFTFLRIVGYPVNLLQVAWPASWHRVGEARGWFFIEKARKAFAANRTGEALLYLSNAYEFDPSNYAAGLTLAKTLQAGQPVASNQVYDRLLREHPAERELTSEEWFRALLARGDFTTIQALARDRILANTPHASVWMRALVFATRQSGRDEILRSLRDNPDPAAAVWRPLIETELLFLAGRQAEARARLDHTDWRRLPPYGVYYQVSQLLDLGDVFAALDQLAAAGPELDPETRVTLELAAYARQGAHRPFQQLVDQLLGQRLSLPIVKIVTTQLIRQPDPVVLDQLYALMQRQPIPITSESAGVYFSFLCAAGVQGDWAKFHALGRIMSGGASLTPPLYATVEAFFRGRTTSSRITSVLPALPLPVEVTYTLIERYPGLPASPPKPIP
jgi:hypothetical protein